MSPAISVLRILVHRVRVSSFPIAVLVLISVTAGLYLAVDNIVKAETNQHTQPSAPVESGVPSSANTFVVDKTDDTQDASPGDGVCADAAGGCSLRAAITEANANPAGHLITLPAGTYTQSLTAANEDSNAGGDWDITSAMTIRGAGAATTIIQANAAADAANERVIHCSGYAPSVTIDGVTIRHGVNRSTAQDAGGGGIRIETATTSVRLTNVTVNNNRSEGSGGGITLGTSGATLVIYNSTISNNHAGSYEPGSGHTGGGIDISGAIANVTSFVYISYSSITGNTVNSGINYSIGGGFSVTQIGASITLDHCTINNNAAIASGLAGFGGGIYNQEANVTISDSVVSGNSATGHGGIRTLSSIVSAAITNITNSTISNNIVQESGAGVVNITQGPFDSTTTISTSTISGNTVAARRRKCCGRFELQRIRCGRSCEPQHG